MAPAERAPLTDEVAVAFIGGGFAGLVTGARLKQAGIDDVRIIEKGGDVGGTWYWNRYPGAQCDTAAFIYLPLLEETGHMPTEKYTHAPEILEHCQRIAKHFDLYDNACLSTEVTGLEWDDDVVTLDHPHQPRRRDARQVRGDGHRARCTARSCPASPASRRSPATASTPAGGTTTTPAATPRAGRWIVSPTSASGSSAPAPRPCSASRTWLAACGELYVFQRTPSSIDIRNNHPIDPDWFATLEPGWQDKWLMNFTILQTGGFADEDLVKDGWTDISQRIRDKVLAGPDPDFSPAAIERAYHDSDDEKMNEIRARVDADRRRRLDRRRAQAVVPPAVQAAVLPRRVPPGVQQAWHAPGRHRRQGRRAHRRDRRVGRRAALRARLPDLRLRLRGRHRLLEAIGLRRRRPRRTAAVRALGRRDAEPPRHPCPRLPEPLRRRADPGRQPDLQRPAQPHRGRRARSPRSSPTPSRPAPTRSR